MAFRFGGLVGLKGEGHRSAVARVVSCLRGTELPVVIEREWFGESWSAVRFIGAAGGSYMLQVNHSDSLVEEYIGLAGQAGTESVVEVMDAMAIWTVSGNLDMDFVGWVTAQMVGDHPFMVWDQSAGFGGGVQP